MTTAKAAYSHHVAISTAATVKTFNLAAVNGYPEQVTAKGFHRGTQQFYPVSKVTARDLYEARVKFLAGQVD